MSRLNRWMLAWGAGVVWMAGLGGSVGWAGEDRAKEELVRRLRDRVEALEKRVAELEKEAAPKGWRLKIPAPGGRGLGWVEWWKGPMPYPRVRPAPPGMHPGPGFVLPFEYWFYRGPAPPVGGRYQRRVVPFEFNGEIFYLVPVSELEEVGTGR